MHLITHTHITCGLNGYMLLILSPSGALVDIFMDYKYMYFACGMMMVVPGLFLFIMNFFNYRWLEQEQQKQEALRIGSASELAAIEEANDIEQDNKLSQEQKFMDLASKDA